MTEQELKLQTRLAAIEYILQKVLANTYLICGFDRQQIERGHQATKLGLQNETLPGADAALADMWMSEIEQRVTDLQSSALETWASMRRTAGLPD